MKVDANGVGASAYDALARCEEVTALAVNTAEASSSPEVYANLRAQLAFSRGLAQGRRAIPRPPEDAGGPVTPKYRFDARNRFLVESKDDVKKTLKRSPDYGDALALAV